MDNIQLTSFSRSSGCGCKIAPAVLHGLLDNQFTINNANVLVGMKHFDDASVIAINETDCIISTVDFFTPIVNNPSDFGAIAAANAISDIYAMGGKPITAVSILGFPVDKIEAAVIREILAGAEKKCEEAGISITGGHSIESPEPFFGLSVTGIIKREHIRRNNTAKSGDLIYMTKPLGTGIFSAALKKGLLMDDDYSALLKSASELNAIGQYLGEMQYVHAMTDITGFGLLGHLLEMCEGAKLEARIAIQNVPLLPNIKAYTDQFCIPDNTYRNWNACEAKVTGITPESFLTLNDPQTNGGLLIAINKSAENDFLTLISSKGKTAYYIGSFQDSDAPHILLNA